MEIILLSSLSTCMLFIYFSCLVALAKISRTVLHKSGKKWAFVPIPDLFKNKNNVFSFSLFSLRLVMAGHL
jgi:hypothetical protein